MSDLMRSYDPPQSQVVMWIAFVETFMDPRQTEMYYHLQSDGGGNRGGSYFSNAARKARKMQHHNDNIV